MTGTNQIAVSPATQNNTSISLVVDPMVLDLRLVYLIVTKYAWMVVAFIGLFGNVMSIVITLQKDNRRISTCNYMTGLAFADSGVLIEYVWGMSVLCLATEPPSLLVME
jgi:hypothetical protein